MRIGKNSLKISFFLSVLAHSAFLVFFYDWSDKSLQGAKNPSLYSEKLSVQMKSIFPSKTKEIPRPIKKKQAKKVVKKNKISKKPVPKDLPKPVKKREVTKSSPPSLFGTKIEKKRIAAYKQELRTFLERNKVYPRAARRLKHTGTVEIKLKILKNGTFQAIRVITPSSFGTLNRAAVELLEELKQFKPLPMEYAESEEFIIPIAYQMKGGRRL